MSSLSSLLLLVCFALLLRRRASAESRRGRLLNGLALLALALLLLGFQALTGHGNFALILLALLLLIPGSLRQRPRLSSPAFLEGRGVLVLAGLLSAAAAWWVWGSLNPAPIVHDEVAYLLQAQIFASGRGAAAGRPLPEFFEQMHVLVTPFLASKYPPGHSLVLVPGIWLGMPALAPLLLNGFAATLLFAHARRMAGGAVALLTWLLWVTAPWTFEFRSSYLSQNTTTVLWLLALWALREWLASGARGWVVLLGVCLGWGAITRPMTMFAFALPIAAVFLWRVVTRRAWPDLALAAAAGSLCLAILPFWNAGATGDWRTSPYRHFSRVYYPYEWVGFGLRTEPALRPLPYGMEGFERQFKRIHAEHTVAALPETIDRRARAIANRQWGGGRELLALFALLGALMLCREGLFALASCVLLVAGYLTFAHSPAWAAYYLEIQTFLSYVTALGVCGVAASVAAISSSSPDASKLSVESRGRLLFAGLLLAVGLPSLFQVVKARQARETESDYQVVVWNAIAQLPEPRSIVFVRRSPGHNVHRSLVFNEPDLSSARAWIVHDLGPRNRELARLAPDRRTYLYDETTRRILPLDLNR